MTNSTQFKRLLFLKFLLFFTAINLSAATLDISTSQINAGCHYTEGVIQITSDLDWNYTVSDSWIYARTDWSFGNNTMTYEIAPNNSVNPRTGTIIFSGTGVETKIITITQAGLSADSYETNDAETSAFNVTYVFNRDVASLKLKGTFHTSSDIDYYKIDLPAGYKYSIRSDINYEGSNYMYVYMSNKVGNGSWSSSSRYNFDLITNSGTVYIKISPYVVGVLGSYTFDVLISRIDENATLTASVTELYLNSDGSPVNFNIASNTNWLVDSYSSWLSYTPDYGSNNQTVNVSAEVNPLYTKRTGTLDITAGGILNTFINIVQYGKNLPDDKYEPNNSESTARELSMTLADSTCNILDPDLNISSVNDTDFYKIYLPAGSAYTLMAQAIPSDQYHYFQISYKKDNSGSWSSPLTGTSSSIYYSGGGYIYFKVYMNKSHETGPYTFNVLVNKNKTSPVLTVSSGSLNIDAAANSTATFNITSNSGWMVSSSSEWLTIDPSSGWRNGTVTITAKANNSPYYSRTGYVYVICPGLSKKTIYVSQNYRTTLLPDDFETNDTEEASSALPLNFTDNNSFIKTPGTNLHTSTDIDYFKITLPEGYQYTISSRLQDSYNHDDDETYSLDAKYCYKTSATGTWSYNADTRHSSFNFEGGDIFFKVMPYFSNDMGNYSLQIEIIKSDGSAVLNVSDTYLSIADDNLSTATFSISSQGTIWNISCSESWLTPSVTTGSDNAEIILTATANPKTSYRYAVVTISGDGVPPGKIDVYQEGKDLMPDSYESNDSENAASGLNLAFNGNEAVFISNNLNMHTEDDRDYFRISLDDGYCYTVSAGTTNTNCIITYKTGTSTTWSSLFYGNTPEISVIGKNDLYFFIESANKGEYELSISVKREPYSLSSSVTDLSMNAVSGSVSLDILSNIDWLAISSQNWLNVSPESGFKNATITLTADDNLFAANRTATVTLKGKDITKTITVTQNAADPYLSVNSNTLAIPAAANNSGKFMITSNTNWTITSSQPWLTVNVDSGAGDVVITAVAEANTASSGRTAQLTVSGSGFNEVITVTQNGAGTDPVLSVSTTALTVNKTENSTATFSITSNTDWSVTSYESWLNVSNGSGSGNATITLTAAANTTVNSRTAEVSVAVTGISKTITVTQMPGDTVLNVSSDTLRINALRNSSATFNITSNVSWTVAGSQPWLEISSESGSGDATIMVRVSANEKAVSRSAIVTVKKGSVSRTITVIQEAANSTLDVFENSFIFSADANSNASFNITSNASWTVTSSESWLTVDKPSGSDNSTVTATAAANTSVASRTATITIAVPGKSHVINVTQAGITTGTDDVLNPVPQLYPNPVVHKLRIEYPGEQVQKHVKIFSEKGELKLDQTVEENTFETDMSDYQSGVYFLQISTENGTRTFKVIKQ